MKYAFLPREAVTRFLMSCADCQKRMHLSSPDGSNSDTVNTSYIAHQSHASFRPDQDDLHGPPIVDFSMPITQTYLNHLKYRNLQTDVYSDEVGWCYLRYRNLHTDVYSDEVGWCYLQTDVYSDDVG